MPNDIKPFAKFAVEVVDIMSISFAFFYIRFNDVISYIISDAGLKKATMFLTLVYIGVRIVYWIIKTWKLWQK